MGSKRFFFAMLFLLYRFCFGKLLPKQKPFISIFFCRFLCLLFHILQIILLISKLSEKFLKYQMFHIAYAVKIYFGFC